MANMAVFVISMVDDENKRTPSEPQNSSKNLLIAPEPYPVGIATLVKEYEAGTRKVLHKLLKDYGLNIAEAENGQIALDELKKQSLGVLFLDLMIQIMDQFKFLEELRKSPEGQTIPIMFITLNELTHADLLLLNRGIEKLTEK